MNTIIIALAALIAVASAAPLKGEPSVLAEWEAYKTKHSKHYAEPEESWHYNIFLASKAGVETQNKLHEKGLESFKKELDEWSDVPLKEVAVPGYDTLSADEWAKYKETHGKVYADPKEDEVRRTIYYKKKQEFNDHNQLYEKGHVSWSKGINQFTDHFNTEGPATGLIIPEELKVSVGVARTKRHQTGKLPLPDNYQHGQGHQNEHGHGNEHGHQQNDRQYHTGAIIAPHHDQHNQHHGHH